MKNDVCIGVITAGNVHMACVESLLAVVTSKVANWVFLRSCGPYLDDGRNNLVQAFLDDNFKDCSRLLMVDSDIEFRPDHVQQLIEDDLPIVSGVYQNSYSGVLKPVVYQWTDVPVIEQTPDKRFKSGYRETVVNTLRTMEPIDGWAEDDPRALVNVDGCGAGFLMIHRDVLEEFPKHYAPPQPWFAEDTYFGTHFGEDLCFNVRAAEIGISTVVDRRVVVGHHKTVRL